MQTSAIPDPFQQNLERLLGWARSSRWLAEEVDNPSHPALVRWEGTVTHSTDVSAWEQIRDIGFIPAVREHSTLGKAVYFFPGIDGQEISDSVHNAEAYYRHFSNSRTDGVILMGDFSSDNVFDRRTPQATHVMEEFYRHVAKLLENFMFHSPYSAEEKVLPTRAYRGSILWTLFFLKFPGIDAAIASSPCSDGHYRSVVQYMGVTKPVDPGGFCVHRNLIWNLKDGHNGE